MSDLVENHLQTLLDEGQASFSWQPTDSQIAAWERMKQERQIRDYRFLYIPVQTFEQANGEPLEVAVACLKLPDRTTVSRYLHHQDPITQASILLDDCWLDGDKRIKDDDDLFLAAVPRLQELTSVPIALLQKKRPNMHTSSKLSETGGN